MANKERKRDIDFDLNAYFSEKLRETRKIKGCRQVNYRKKAALVQV